MVLDLRFRKNDDGWFNWGEGFGLVWREGRIGVNFRVPQAGFLKFNVVIQNLYNKISCSVSDNFGFSDANLHVFHSLKVEVERLSVGQRLGFETDFVTTGIISHGREISNSTSQIQNSTPFTLSFRPDRAFLAGEELRVAAVSKIQINCNVNDMEANVNAVLMWQLKKILVSWVRFEPGPLERTRSASAAGAEQAKQKRGGA